MAKSLDAMNADELSEMGEQVATLLGGTTLSAIDAATRTDLLTGIGTLPADVAALDAEANGLADQTTAKYSERDDAEGLLRIQLRSTRTFLEAGNAPKEQFDLCGFNYPFGPRGTVIAQTPTDLAVQAYTGQIIRGTFRGNNTSGNISYEVWRREGDEGPWGMRVGVSKQSFKETEVTPGQYYEYKVRARAATNVSDFSNPVVVYGV